MREIVYVVYHDLNKEARSMEVLRGLQKCGNVHLISIANPIGFTGVDVHIVNKASSIALIKLLLLAKKVIKSVCPDWVVLHDNDCSALLPFIHKQKRKCKIIYDSSELYIKPYGVDKKRFPKEKFGGNDGIGVFIKRKATSFRARYEKRYLKYADVVLAANIERAKIMQEYFGLKELPIVFDNIHKIEDEANEEACIELFRGKIVESRFNILFAGGISEERKTFDFVKTIVELGRQYGLIIVGNASETALRKFNTMINDDRDHIFYLGFIDRPTLRYCMAHCQASVVVFDKDSYNTYYCASGKCYESLFEGTPILASENPPLKRLCDVHKVGISSDDYKMGIIELEKNFEMYRNAVHKYVSELSYESRVERLISTILDVLGEE